MRVTTTRTQPRTVALTTVTAPELTAGMVALTVLMDPRIGAPVTTPTQAPTLEAVQCPRLTAAEVQHKHIIHTPAPMRRRDKVQVPQPNGAARMCRGETRVPPRATTRRPMERWQAPLIRREEKWPLPARSGGTAQQVKPPAVICMPDTMATFTRTRVT